MNNGYIAFVLDEDSRNKILETYVPKYPDVIAHHVTLTFGVPEPEESMMVALNSVFNNIEIKVIRYVDDGKVEVLVVSINDTDIRADGNIYHLTLSIDRSKGAKPVHSNDVIANYFHTVVHPIPITGKVEFISN